MAVPHPDRFDIAWSWRDDTLQRDFDLRPTLVQLLEAPWADFNASGNDDLHRAAALQAMAAVFIRYLDDQQQLKSVYFAVRDQNLSPDLSRFRTSREIIEDSFGRNIYDVDRDFQSWFQKQQSSRLQINETKTRPCSGPAQNACPEVMNKKAD